MSAAARSRPASSSFRGRCQASFHSMQAPSASRLVKRHRRKAAGGTAPATSRIVWGSTGLPRNRTALCGRGGGRLAGRV